MASAIPATDAATATTTTTAGEIQQEKIILYWLSQSRSHRILWLLEELNLQYELKIFMRGKDMLAPPELKQIHPLGKSPVLSVQAAHETTPRIIAESGLIVEYLLDHYGQQLLPARYVTGKEGQLGYETEEWMRYRYFMHYAEGSIMPFMVFALVINQIRNAPVPFFLKPVTRGIASRIDGAFLDRNLKSNVDFLEDQLATSPGGGDWFAGTKLTGADIMLIFPLDAGGSRAGITAERCPRITAWTERCKNREAFKRATRRIEEETGKFFFYSHDKQFRLGFFRSEDGLSLYRKLMNDKGQPYVSKL